MKIKRFTAANMQAGLKTISETLGPEAVILSNRRLANGLEIVAGVDEQEYEIYQQSQPDVSEQSDIIKANPDAIESLDKESIQHLFSAMSNKNKQAFENVSGAVASKSGARQPRAKPVVRDNAEALLPKSKSRTETTTRSTAMDHSAITLLRQEIDGLKDLLKEQTEQLRDPVTSSAVTPQYERLESRLQMLGFSASLIRKMLANFDREESLDQNWRKMMGRLASALPVPLYEPLSAGGVYALMGPTGAGKTTTIAKLAAHGVKDFGADSVAVISLDWYQVGGQEILRSVTNILGVEFKAMNEHDSLTQVLNELKDKRLVLVDTSGSTEALASWNRLIKETGLANRLQTLLVLPATMLTSAVNQFVQQLVKPAFTGTILSKLDESACFGGVLEPVMKHRWPLWYCTTGQNIPQDIEAADARKLTQRLVKGLSIEKSVLATAS